MGGLLALCGENGKKRNQFFQNVTVSVTKNVFRNVGNKLKLTQTTVIFIKKAVKILCRQFIVSPQHKMLN